MILLDGKRLKIEILNELREEVINLSPKPKLVVIQVGNDAASNVYIKHICYQAQSKAKYAKHYAYNFLVWMHCGNFFKLFCIIMTGYCPYIIINKRIYYIVVNNLEKINNE